MFKFLTKFMGSASAEPETDRAAARSGSAARPIPHKPAGVRKAGGGSRAAGKAAQAMVSKSRPTPAAEDHFDPYNTGTFDRSASWERVRKRNL